MATDRESNFLTIVDGNVLRQAAISCLFREWAGSYELEIAQVAPDDLLTALDSSRAWRMIILSVGNESIQTVALQIRLRHLQAISATVPIVIVSDGDNAAEIVAAYRAGCNGYLPTSLQPELALKALDFILGGGTYFPPSILENREDATEHGPDESDPPEDFGAESARFNPPEDTAEGADPDIACSDGAEWPTRAAPDLRVPGLTDRQYQVLIHLHKGEPNKIIARALGVTEGTVKVHVRQIMRRLGAANRTQAAVLCGREGHLAEQTATAHASAVDENLWHRVDLARIRRPG